MPCARRIRVTTTVLLLLLGFSLATHATPGQPGTLDATWATSSPLGAGIVMTPIGNGDDTASAVAVQPDGKVLVAGACSNGTNADFCVVRYRADGTLDTTWNGSGTVITPIGSDIDVARAIALQPDGKVLVAGICVVGTAPQFCALRYNGNGALDSGWNGTGKVITSIGGNDDRALAMALQPDGRVLLAGQCSNGTTYDFCALRYNASGTLDSSWNGNGKVITPIGTSDVQSGALVVQSDGKVLRAGVCVVGVTSNPVFCALRYNTNGSLDSSWNGTGKVITSIGGSDDEATAIAVQPDGKVLLAGFCFAAASNNFCAARYNTNGTLDSSWNGTGKVIAPTIGGNDDKAQAVVLQPDGKALLAGACLSGANNNYCALRFNANGTLDLSWNGTGKVMTAIGNSYSLATAVTLQPDGKALLSGRCNNGSNYDFCTLRYDGGPFAYQNCKLDIDGDGLVLATTDALINMRVALGLTGPAVVNGISFPANATRNTWPLIRDYLVTQCGMSLP